VIHQGSVGTTGGGHLALVRAQVLAEDWQATKTGGQLGFDLGEFAGAMPLAQPFTNNG